MDSSDSIWFIIISAASSLSASAEPGALSGVLLGISGLMLYRKEDFERKLSRSQIAVAFLVVAFLFLSAIMGWTLRENIRWEHYIYRPHVVFLGWLLLMALGLRSLKKELRTNSNKG